MYFSFLFLSIIFVFVKTIIVNVVKFGLWGNMMWVVNSIILLNYNFLNVYNNKIYYILNHTKVLSTYIYLGLWNKIQIYYCNFKLLISLSKSDYFYK